MKNIILQSSLYEDGINDLTTSLNLAIISINRNLRLKDIYGCEDFLKVHFNNYKINTVKAYEVLEKAIELNKKQRIDTFSMFSNDEVCEMTFGIKN